MGALRRRDRRLTSARAVISLALLAAVARTEPAAASTASELYRTKALFAIGEHDYDRALDWLNQAVDADNDDTWAYYYRGVAHSRRGEADSALADFARARVGGLEHPDLAYETALAHRQRGDYPEAARWLELAKARRPGHLPTRYHLALTAYQSGDYARVVSELQSVSDTARAHERDRIFHLLALAHLKMQRYSPALAALKQVREEDEAARITKAEVLIGLERTAEARALLEESLNGDPESPHTMRAAALLDTLERRGGKTRPFKAELSAGYVHDDNVVLYPQDLPLPDTVPGRGDGRWQLGLDTRYKPGDGPLTVGYRLFQSLHEELTAYDLTHHQLLIDWRRRADRVDFGLAYQYLQAALDDYDYLEAHLISPNLLYSHTRKRLSLLSLLLRRDEYLYPGLEAYDGTRQELEYNHTWVLGPKDHLTLGLLAQRQGARNDDFAFTGHGFNGSMRWAWGEKYLIGADADYRIKTFADATPARRDEVTSLSLRVVYPLGERLRLEADASRIRNHSNTPQYDYDRNLYGVNLKWTL